MSSSYGYFAEDDTSRRGTSGVSLEGGYFVTSPYIYAFIPVASLELVSHCIVPEGVTLFLLNFSPLSFDYAFETWTLSKTEEANIAIRETKILRTIFGGIKEVEIGFRFLSGGGKTARASPGMALLTRRTAWKNVLEKVKALLGLLSKRR
ncbi:hypothetical protein TNCT_49101 [Trichonephila clavata]|uniref:Uncharacterized protein n=1 Tax=Trichonephila clavata TaxID=2740835 RepID=A0A8X6I5Q9_TRICU|nr:hypothetical protein TNCT_49101 [Trichonephila clavata]